VLGFGVVGELPLCAVPNDAWTPAPPLPAIWTPELELVDPWMAVSPSDGTWTPTTIS